MSAGWPWKRAVRAAALVASLLLALGLDLAGQIGHLAYVVPCTVFALLLLAAGWRPDAAPPLTPAGVASSTPGPASSLLQSDGETQWMTVPAAPLPGMMALLDGQARCSAASPGLARWLDSDRDLMRGQSLAQMFGAAAAETLAPQVDAALAGNMRRLRCVHLSANDTERWLQVELQPLLDDFGQPMGCTLLAMDVTPEQRQLLITMGNERRLRFMLDQVPAAVAYVDTDLCYRHINQAQAEALGLGHAEVLGLPVRELVPARHWATQAPALLAALRGQAPAPAAAAADDDKACHLVPDLGAGAKVMGVCSVCMPPAAPPAALGWRLPAGLSLDADAQRPADLTEITRPMRPGADSGAGAHAAPAEAAPALQPVQLQSLAHEALAHAELDQAALAPVLSDLVLRTLVEDVVQQLAPQAQARQLELCCRIDEFLPSVLHADARRLHQVLSHLLANALRFTTDGEVLVDVQRQDEQTLRFLVHDTGPGLSPERQRDLFDALPQRLDAAAEAAPQQPPRHGLGLPLARRLVAMMGGSMGVQSVPGDGASFWFTLPLLAAQSGAQPQQAARLAQRHVLVVDDNTTCRELLAQHLAVLGQRCTLAADGADALALLRQARTEGDPFDLALIDTGMPGMDGLTLASLVRADPLLKAVRLVLLSTRPSHDEMARANQAGVAAYLDKPVRRSALQQALVQALDDGTGARPLAVAASGRGAAASSTPGAHDGAALPLVHARVLLADRPGPQRQRLLALLQALGCDHALADDGEQALQRLNLEHFDLALLAAGLPRASAADVAAAVRQRERQHGSRRHLPLVGLGAQGPDAVTDSAAASRLAGMDDLLPGGFSDAELVVVLTLWLPPELVELARTDIGHPMAA